MIKEFEAWVKSRNVVSPDLERENKRLLPDKEYRNVETEAFWRCWQASRELTWRDPAEELPPPVTGDTGPSVDVLAIIDTGIPDDSFQQIVYCYHSKETSGFHQDVLAWRYLPDGPEWLKESERFVVTSEEQNKE